MALGGGTFTSYNKVLPGTYINFVSTASASGAVSDRGVCAVAMELSWGKEKELMAVTSEEFLKNSMKYFGYSYMDEKMKGLRDLFKNASFAYVYRLGEGVKATSSYATALCSGVCGNDIKIKIAADVDDSAYFDVVTYYRGVKRDEQKVKTMSELCDNDYVVWNKNATLSENGTVSLSGGSDAEVTGEDYQAFLDAAESVSFNVMAVASESDEINKLVAEYTKKMRENEGVKFQSVLYNCEADDIGVINVVSKAYDAGVSSASLVWFVAGAAAGCAINRSLLNRAYDGSFLLGGTLTKQECEDCIKKGQFAFHKVDGEYRVLADINSLVNTTAELGDVFKENQTVRIVDQIAYDDAQLFKNKYLGIVPNDEAGRLSLWNDITEHRKSLMKMRAIENFKDEDVVVEKGESKTSVVIRSSICPINSMAQLYITSTLE